MSQTGASAGERPGGAAAETNRGSSRREGSYRFGLEAKVRRSAIFGEALSGQRAVGRYMVMGAHSGDDSNRRLGVIASRRTFRRAVDRNRAKRMLREAFRLNRPSFLKEHDVILIARRRILSASLDRLERELLALAGKLSLLERNGDVIAKESVRTERPR